MDSKLFERFGVNTFIGADLERADLERADLERADLVGADLVGADLRSANLEGACLRRADLRRADLRRANLRGADLRRVNLEGANLEGANLVKADLEGADLEEANLEEANLEGAYLVEAKLDPLTSARLSIVPEVGSFIGWKKCRGGQIVKLLIPVNARRSNATSKKCRAEWVKVLEGEGVSLRDRSVKYKVGETVRCHQWEEDRWIECGGGIHFFLTRIEAENY